MSAIAALARTPRPALRSDRRSPAVLFAASVVAVELVGAFAVSSSTFDADLALVAFAAAIVVAACLLVPWPSLVVLAALWAPTHTILADFELREIAGFQLTLSRLLGVVVLVGFGCVLLLDPQRTRLPFALRALVLFLALFVFAAAVSGSASGFVDLLRVASGVTIALVTYRLVDSVARLLVLARVVVFGGLVVAAVTIVQFALIRLDPALAHQLFGEAFYTRSYDVTDVGLSAVRVNGPLGGAGETAGVLLVAFAFGLVRYSLRRDRGARTGDALILVVLGLGVVSTLTRAATLGLVVLMLCWILQRQLRSVSPIALRARVALLVAAVALLTVPALGAQTVQSRFSDVNPASAGTSFAQGRGGIWAAELGILRSSEPMQVVLGHGAHASYVPVIAADNEIVDESPHNVLLWLLVETGLAGTLAYLAFVVGLARAFVVAARSQRYRPAGQIAAVGLATVLAYLALDFFSLTVPSPGHRWYFMLLVGASLRLCLQRSEPRAQEL